MILRPSSLQRPDHPQAKYRRKRDRRLRIVEEDVSVGAFAGWSRTSSERWTTLGARNESRRNRARRTIGQGLHRRRSYCESAMTMNRLVIASFRFQYWR